MISTSSLVLDGHHGHGLGPGPTGGPHHLTFVDPYLRSKLPGVPEFIRPFPKSAPIVPRFSEQRPSPSESPRKEYPGSQLSTPTSGPVNLTSVKLDGASIPENHISTTSVNIQIPHLPAAYSSGMFPPPGFPYSGLQNPYGSLYPSSYSSLLNRPTYINSTPLSSLERQYSPPQKGNNNSSSPGVFLQPPGTYPNPNATQVAPPPPPPPPPQTTKSNQLQFREKRPFKIPSGKETNGKQRFLSSGKSSAKRVTLPTHVNSNGNSNSNNNNNNNNSSSSNNNNNSSNNNNNNNCNNNNNGNNNNTNFNNNNSSNNSSNNNNNNNNSNSNGSNNNNNNNNNLLPPNFTKGSLIQLANGELRRVEDVTTEELVSSAEKCPAFRLDPSTVVRIEENSHGTVLLTLSYGENKKTIEMESTLEHPYFVYGQGWASCSPERTMNCYGLQCHRLQVGDICISLSPRQNQDFGVLPTVNQ